MKLLVFTLARWALIAGMLAAPIISLGQPAAQPTIESVKARVASYPPDLRVYALFRFWLTSQPPAVQKQFDDAASAASAFDRYRQSLLAEGESAAEAERKMRLIQSKREDLEIELWNQILTSDSPRLNREPNAFLVEIAKTRKPGRALDVGMGQGRNAIWLAQQGWDTTGFDPAEQAVAAARRTAEQRRLKLQTVVAKDSAFDFGESKWDLILLSYVDMRHLAARVVKALAPGGIVVAEYFHQDSAGVSGGFADNELVSLFPGLRVVRYEDTEGLSDFGKTTDRLVRLAAEKRGK
jgi:SAM-dependent methyltransferase